MTEENLKSEINSLLPTSLLPKTEEHPLHMLDNQADPETKPKVVLQKTIRTYESDVADALANKKTSVMTMAIAEQKRATTQEVPAQDNSEKKNNAKKIFISILSVVFIGAGLAGGYYLYLKSPLVPDPSAKPVFKISSLITPDTQKVISVNSLDGDRLIKFLDSEFGKYEIGSEKILEFIPAQTIASTTIRMTGPQFMTALNFDIPDILKRSLTDKMMLGIYESNDNRLPFLILKTDFFQNAFAGMLKWESSMPEELAVLFEYRDKARSEDNISTTSIASYFNIRGTFEDKTVANRDVREFINDKGQMLFLYTFLDQNTMLIATSELTIINLISRIEKQTYMR